MKTCCNDHWCELNPSCNNDGHGGDDYDSDDDVDADEDDDDDDTMIMMMLKFLTLMWTS